MTSLYQRSAIDDTGLPIIQPRFQNYGPEAPSLPYQQYNGPRSGHWSVSSSINGSAIDDRVPTVHNSPGPMRNDGTPRQIHAVPASVLKKLMKVNAANDAKRVVEEKARAAAEKAGPVVPEEAAQRPADPVRMELPRGFFIPKTNARGIRIKGKNGRSEVMKRPQYLMPVIQEDDSVYEKKESKSQKTEKSRASSPQPSAKSNKAPSSIAQNVQQDRKLRILSKDGVEVLMDLPKLSGQTRSTRQAPSPNKDRQTSETDKQQKTQRKAEVEKLERDANAARAARVLQAERAHEDEWKQNKTKRATKPPMMSGALPNSSQTSSVSKKSSPKSSIKESAPPARRQTRPVSEKASRPASIASSITSIAPSWKPESEETTPQASRQNSKPPSQTSSISEWLEPALDKSDPANWKPSPLRSAGTGPWPLNESAQRSLRTQSNWSRQASEKTYEHSLGNDWGFQQIGSQNGWVLPESRQGSFCDLPWGGRMSSDQVSNYAEQWSQHSRQDSIDSRLLSNGAGFVKTVSNGSIDQASPRGHRPLLNGRSFSTDTAFEEASLPPGARHLSPSERPPTVYAGRGWISPHPLSLAPSQYNEEPQHAIHIPSAEDIRGVTTMTYDDWLDIRQKDDQAWVRRNVSRTTSDAQSRGQAGSWGHRIPPQLSVNDTKISYRSPVAESVQSGRWSSMKGSVHQSVRSGRPTSQDSWNNGADERGRGGWAQGWNEQQHQTRGDGWADGAGSVQLRMPRDGGEKKMPRNNQPVYAGHADWD